MYDQFFLATLVDLPSPMIQPQGILGSGDHY